MNNLRQAVPGSSPVCNTGSCKAWLLGCSRVRSLILKGEMPKFHKCMQLVCEKPFRRIQLRTTLEVFPWQFSTKTTPPPTPQSLLEGVMRANQPTGRSTLKAIFWSVVLPIFCCCRWCCCVVWQHFFVVGLVTPACLVYHRRHRGNFYLCEVCSCCCCCWDMRTHPSQWQTNWHVEQNEICSGSARRHTVGSDFV